MTRLDRTNAVHHVYRCYDETGRLIYVGSSANLFGRLTQHRRTSWWASQVVRVTAKVYPNGTVAREHERQAIRTENPRWNKSGRWETRHVWDRAGWDDWLTLLLRRKTYAPELRRFVDLYVRRWGSEPDAASMAAVLASEDAHRQAKIETQALMVAQKARQAELERADELALRRERKRAKAKAKRLAKKLREVKEVIRDCDLAIES